MDAAISKVSEEAMTHLAQTRAPLVKRKDEGAAPPCRLRALNAVWKRDEFLRTLRRLGAENAKKAFAPGGNAMVTQNLDHSLPAFAPLLDRHL